MQVKEVMTKDPVCCTREAVLPDVARLMVAHDVGAIPVVESIDQREPVGMITDRDICCRTVALNKNPLEMTVSDCTTDQCVSVSDDASLEECARKMRDAQVRRVVVVDEHGKCCGIVAQADLANADPQQAAETVGSVSRPTASASAVSG